MVYKVFAALAVFVVGILVGAVLLLLSAFILRFDHPMLSLLGIRKPQVIGFLPYWLADKTQPGYEHAITTLTYFGLVVDTDGKPIFLVNPTEEEPGWTTLKGDVFSPHLKKAQDKHLKTSLLVHAANEAVIAELLVDPQTKARALVAEVGPIMKKRGFTDLNLDIESFLPASDSARNSFTLFVQTVKDEVRSQELGTLTVEMAPIMLAKPMLVDPSRIGELADYVVLMAYDYHYSGSFVAGPVAPINGAGEVWEFDIETALKEATLRIPPQKILLGIPLYGYQWETIDDNGYAATIPGGSSTASNRRVSELLSSCATCSASVDPISQEPVVRYREGNVVNQIYYEDRASLQKKLKLAETYMLGGVALWALGYEDANMLEPLITYKRRFRFSP